jgi:hypothetical protein
MKKFTFLSAFVILYCMQMSAFTFNGTAIQENNNYTRTKIGTTASSLEEISGIACSRTTQGYFWVHVDQGSNIIYALNPDGSIKQQVTLQGATNDDWEDICVATVNGVNYVFVGSIGDNNLKEKNTSSVAGKGTYKIYCFEEPVIDGTNKTATDVKTITYTYESGHNTADSKNNSHNCETLMYDPITNKIYLVTKHKTNVSGVYVSPSEWSFANQTIQMKWVCDLGIAADNFLYLTAGDISADGSKVLIKSKTDILYWERQGSENLSVTLARQPQHIAAYQEETQGEAVAWANDNRNFYTTSEGKSQPLYYYEYPLPAIATPTNVNASATDNSITITWEAVDGATGYQIKVCHTETASGGGATGTSFTQVFNDASTGDKTANFTVGDIVVMATSDKKVTITASSKTVGGISYTKYLDLGGGGSTEYRSIKFTTDGSGTLTVYNDGGSNTRSLVLSDGANIISTVSNNTAVFNITTAGTYYVYSAGSGIKVYALDFAGGSGSSSICDDTHQTTSTSLTIPGLDSGTEYTYQVRAIKDAQQSEYSTAKTISTTGTSTSIAKLVVFVQNGQLFFENSEDGKIEIYNLSGQKVASGHSGSINVQNLKGFYVVRAGNRSAKVIF